MPEDSRPPVAIRITRPYATEEELLEQELETLTHTSVTLLGAQPRPQGVVLRFEIVLSSGQVAMRGEGRVVGFRPNAHQGLGGLTLRFTRLDSRSKALVDKASALRERRRPSASPHDMAPPSRPALPIPSMPAPVVPSIPIRAEPPPLPPARAVPSVSAPAARGLVPPPLPVPMPRSGAGTAPEPEAPLHRDALLDRLRSRGKALDAAAVQSILELHKRA